MTTTSQRRRPSWRSTAAGLAAAAALWLFVAGPVTLGGPVAYIKVTGQSMEPTYFTNDLVMTRRQSSYKIGDVVAFDADGGIVIHRIVAGNGTDGFVTQGDNNSFDDPWTPTEEDILGAAWLHIPGVGDTVDAATAPAPAAGALAAGAALTGSGTKRRKRRRTTKRGTPVTRSRPAERLSSTAATLTSSRLPSLTSLAVTASLALVLAVLAAFSWTTSTTRTTVVEHSVGAQRSSFVLDAHTEASSFDPAGLRHLDAPGAVAFTQLTSTLEVAYRFEAEGAGTADHPTGLDLVVAADDDSWSERMPLVTTAAPPAADGSVELHTTVDLFDLRDQIVALAAETGLRSPGYKLRLEPAMSGRDALAEPAVLSWTSTTITVDSELQAATSVTEAQQRHDSRSFELAGVRLSVATARWMALGALVAAVAAAAVTAKGLRGRWHLAWLRTRAGSLLVEATVPVEGEQPVPVADFPTLVRVAKREGTAVVHHHDGEHHRFTTTDAHRSFEWSCG